MSIPIESTRIGMEWNGMDSNERDRVDRHRAFETNARATNECDRTFVRVVVVSPVFACFSPVLRVFHPFPHIFTRFHTFFHPVSHVSSHAPVCRFVSPPPNVPTFDDIHPTPSRATTVTPSISLARRRDATRHRVRFRVRHRRPLDVWLDDG